MDNPHPWMDKHLVYGRGSVTYVPPLVDSSMDYFHDWRRHPWNTVFLIR